MTGVVIEIVEPKGNRAVGAKKGTSAAVVARGRLYEHPFMVRLCHWGSTRGCAFVMVEGWAVVLPDLPRVPKLRAKIPQKDLLHWPKAFAIGGWLGEEGCSGILRSCGFTWRAAFSISATSFSAGTIARSCSCRGDIPGRRPMVKHYFSLARNRRFARLTTLCRSMLTPVRLGWVFSQC